jgi:hypothetical protein
MTKSVFSKLCSKHGGYVSTSGNGYDQYVVYDRKRMSGGGINHHNNMIDFFGGRTNVRTFVGEYTGGKKSNVSELDNFMAYLQGKGNSLVAGDIAGANTFLRHTSHREEEDDDDE